MRVPRPTGTWARLRGKPVALAALAVLALVALAAVFGPALLPAGAGAMHLRQRNLGPGPGHWFGTDALGRNLALRVCLGGRVSLLIGLAAVALDLMVGAVWGAIAAWSGGWADTLMMRGVDLLYSVPYLVVAMVLLLLLGRGLATIVLAIAIVNWLGMARLVRGQVLALIRAPFVLAARASGAPGLHVLRHHLLPNLQAPVLAWLSFSLPQAIFAEAYLSYLGLGVQPPNTSWGTMVAQGADVLPAHAWQFAFPSLVLCLTLACCFLVGDGLRQAMDPRG